MALRQEVLEPEGIGLRWKGESLKEISGVFHFEGGAFLEPAAARGGIVSMFKRRLDRY